MTFMMVFLIKNTQKICKLPHIYMTVRWFLFLLPVAANLYDFHNFVNWCLLL